MLEFNATFFLAMLSFIVFMMIMNSILYKPISDIQKERAELIYNENLAAKKMTEQTELLKKQQADAIEQSKLVAKDNFNRKVSEYKIRKDAILSASKELAKKEIEISNAELEGNRKEAKLLLKPQVVELANLIATKVLGYETSVEENS